MYTFTCTIYCYPAGPLQTSAGRGKRGALAEYTTLHYYTLYTIAHLYMRLYCTLLHRRASSNKRFVCKVWGICSRTQWVISISQTPWVIQQAIRAESVRHLLQKNTALLHIVYYYTFTLSRILYITTLQGLFKQAIRVQSVKHLLTNSMSHLNLTNSMSHHEPNESLKYQELKERFTHHEVCESSKFHEHTATHCNALQRTATPWIRVKDERHLLNIQHYYILFTAHPHFCVHYKLLHCRASSNKRFEWNMRGICSRTQWVISISQTPCVIKQAIRVEHERHLLTNSMSHLNLTNSMRHQTSDSYGKCEALAEYLILRSYTFNHNILLQIHAYNIYYYYSAGPFQASAECGKWETSILGSPPPSTCSSDWNDGNCGWRQRVACCARPRAPARWIIRYEYKNT